MALARADPNANVPDEEWIAQSPVLLDAWGQLLDQHLAALNDQGKDWTYVAAMAWSFDFLPSYWKVAPNMIPFYETKRSRSGRPTVRLAAVSIADVADVSELHVVVPLTREEEGGWEPPDSHLAAMAAYGERALYAPCLRVLERTGISFRPVKEIFAGRQPIGVSSLCADLIAVDWVLEPPADTYAFPFGARSKPRPWNRADLLDRSTSFSMSAVDLDVVDARLIAIPLHLTWDATYEHVLFNASHPVVQWLGSLFALEATGAVTLGTGQRLALAAYNAAVYGGSEVAQFATILERWRASAVNSLAPIPDDEPYSTEFGLTMGRS